MSITGFLEGFDCPEFFLVPSARGCVGNRAYRGCVHELVDLGHSMTHAVVGLCRDETRTSEHVGISPAQEGNWLESQTDLGVQCVQSDRGREYMGRDLLHFMRRRGSRGSRGQGTALR
jgi:hypothetical protein